MKSLFLSLPFLSLTLHAIDDANLDTLKNRISALEQKKSGGGILLPPDGPFITEDKGICLDVDLLVWKPHQTGMSYAEGFSAAATNPFKKLNCRFDPGFRLQFGVRPNHDDWQLDAAWTHFYAKANNNTGEAVQPNFYSNVISANASTTSATWRMHENLVDLQLSRATFVSKWLSVKPYIGVRNAWLNQKYTVVSTITGNVGEAEMKSYLWGVGPQVGLELKLALSSGWYLFNNLNNAILWGFFKNSQDTFDLTNTALRNMDVHTSTYNFDIALGLGWHQLVDDGLYHVSLRGAWEQNMFFNTNYFTSYANIATINAYDTPKGSLSMEGFTFSFRLDF